MVEIIIRKTRRNTADYELKRKKAGSIQKLIVWEEEVWLGFNACALNSDINSESSSASFPWNPRSG